jgi:hypothetical protein
MDDLSTSGEPIIIMKKSKSIAKLVSADAKTSDDVFKSPWSRALPPPHITFVSLSQPFGRESFARLMDNSSVPNFPTVRVLWPRSSAQLISY